MDTFANKFTHGWTESRVKLCCRWNYFVCGSLGGGGWKGVRAQGTRHRAGNSSQKHESTKAGARLVKCESKMQWDEPKAHGDWASESKEEFCSCNTASKSTKAQLRLVKCQKEGCTITWHNSLGIARQCLEFKCPVVATIFIAVRSTKGVFFLVG